MFLHYPYVIVRGLCIADLMQQFLDLHQFSAFFVLKEILYWVQSLRLFSTWTKVEDFEWKEGLFWT